MKRFFALLFLLASLFASLILSSSVLHFAQETTPHPPEGETTPAPADRRDIDCEPVALAEHQAELMALLDDFEALLTEDESEALAVLYTVGKAYQEMALTCGYIPDDINSLVINTTDIERVMNVLDTLYGDSLNGQLLYNGEIPAGGGAVISCSGCHNEALVAPLTEGTWTRWDEERRLLPEYADESFDYYTVESILLPWHYFVPTYPEFTMPDFYNTQLSYQDLADLVAYLESQDQLVEE